MTDAGTAPELRTVSAAFEELVARVLPDQGERATPCSAWDVRAVVNHVVAGQVAFVSLLTDGGPIDRDADFLGSDPHGAVRLADARLLEALAGPDVLGRRYRSPIGEVPGAAIQQLRLVELLVHGWDLSVATDEPFDVPEEIVDQAITGSRAMLGNVPRTGHPFGPEQEAGADATPLDRLAALLGRPVPWPGTDAPG